MSVGIISLFYSVFKDSISWIKRFTHKPSSSEILQRRQKWDSIFKEKIFDTQIKKLRKDIIIRDMRRIDDYPNTDSKNKGISSWFRVGLIDTYHRGIQVGLGWKELVKDENENYRYPKIGETTNCKAILVGFIPYENIEDVNWDGDEYYGFPIVYCHFLSGQKEPYEEIFYCEQKFLDDKPFYTKLVSYFDLEKNKKKIMTLKLNSRFFLQLAIAIAGCVPVSAGLYGVLLGKDMLGKATTTVALDSHICYLSGLLLGIGIAFWNFIPKIERRSKEVLLLTLIVFIGGLARLYDALFINWPPLPMQLALVMELIVTPLLCLWQRRVAKQYAAQSV